MPWLAADASWYTTAVLSDTFLPAESLLPMTFPITIYARWTHRQETPQSVDLKGVVFYYEVPVCPCTPLRPGLRVKVLLLVNARFHGCGTTGSTDDGTPIYDTYDQWVGGRLEMAGVLVGGTAAFIVRNEHDESPIHYAHISIPIIHGYTTDIVSFATPPNTTAAAIVPQPWAQFQRRIAIERGAIVNRDTWIRMLPIPRSPYVPLPPPPTPHRMTDAATSGTLEVHSRKTMLFKKRLGTATGGGISAGRTGGRETSDGGDGFLLTVMSWSKA